MIVIVTALQPVVVIVMPRFKRAVDAAMLPPAKPELMGTVMTVFDAVVRVVVPIFQALVLSVMAIARAIFVCHCGHSNTQRDH